MPIRTAADRLRDIAAGWPVPAAAEEQPAVFETAVDGQPGGALEGEPSWRERLDVRLDGRAQRAIVAVIAAVVLIAVWMWWSGRPATTVPLGEPVASAPAVAEVVVHVVGAVRTPGVIRLPVGARVGDAIEAAGGATRRKALGSVNLARVLVDGEQVSVGTAGASITDGKLSLNAASAAQLEDLPGIGPALASRIVAWRDEHGPFASVDALDEVSGIGPSVLGQVRAFVVP